MPIQFKMKKRFVSVLAFLLIPLAMGTTFLLMDSAEPQDSIVPSRAAPPVSVVKVSPNIWQAEIRVNGVAEPLNKVDLSSEEAGRVIKLAPDFREGAFVTKGQALAYLDDIQNKRDLATAIQALSDAKVNYSKEEHKNKQAERDWARLKKGTKPGSDLVLNVPQLRAAKARLDAAQADVDLAKSKLDKTIVRSPFDAIVVKRHVNLGQVLSNGSLVTTLIEYGKSKVKLQLNERKWHLLASDIRNRLAKGENLNLNLRVQDPLNSETKWMSHISRMGGERNAKTRQRSLISEINTKEGQPLLAGTFVQAIFEGQPVQNVLNIPSSAVSVDGYIWSVGGDSRLHRHKAQVLEMHKGQAYVYIDKPVEDLTVVVAPLASMLDGQEVTPIPVVQGVERAS